MTEIQTFSSRMIEGWLAAQQLKFRETDEGFVVPFGPGGPGQPDMLVILSAEGMTGEVLVVRSLFDRKYPVAARSALREPVDEWNRSFRFPSALTVADDEVAAVMGEFQIDLGGGTFAAQVGRQLGIGVSTASGLRSWLTEHTAELVEELVPAEQLDADLERLFAGEFDGPAAA